MNTGKTVKKKLVLKKSVRSFCTRVLITVIIFLVGMILVKSSAHFKNGIVEEVYNKNFKFTKIKNLYEKYFGNILSIDKLAVNEQAVFKEKLSYKNAHTYLDGVKLKVDKNYMVPVLESGIVIFVGEKDKYGSTIIVEQVDGVDVYYSNVSSDGVKLYDYVEKGSLLCEAKDENLYLVFQKDGKFLNYKDYI